MTNALLLLSFFFINDDTSREDLTSPLEIEIRLEKEYEVKSSKKSFEWAVKRHGYIIPGDSVIEKHFDISIAIKNRTDTSVFIYMMTCSWWENFIINNNYIFMDVHDCDHNFPTRKKLNPGEIKYYNTTLIKSIQFDYPPANTYYGKQVETTKLGLIFTNENSTDPIFHYDLFMEDRSKWQIIWSNPLYLLGKQPEPFIIDVPAAPVFKKNIR